MRVVYTEDALRDLDAILTFIGQHYPTITAAFESRLRTTIARIRAWPESAPRNASRFDVRVVVLVPYPYKLFYRVTQDAIEILHLYHAARREPWEISRE
jgi:toxin ParE1/3/4